MEKICLHVFVSGRVQGVWYRESTKRQAVERGITGWAKNLTDGRVELVLCGERQRVNTLIDWLHEGPPNARVDSVESAEMTWQHIEDFTTG